MERRAQTADILKGIAVLLMIQVHIVELFATDEISKSFPGKVALFLGSAPVAPIFMITFGYFIFSSHKTTISLIKRGSGIFMLGMLLNLALNFNLLISAYQGKLEVDVWPYIFGVDILQFAGLSLIIIAPLRNVFQKHISIVFCFMFLFPFLGKLLMLYVPENNALLFLSAFFYGSTNWSYFPLFPWLAYPIAGVALYQLQKQTNYKFLDSQKTKIMANSILLTFLVLTARYVVSISSNLMAYYHHGALFFLWVITFCLLYALCVHEINRLTGDTLVIRYIKWLGRNVTLLYIIQWIIIGNIATEIYKTISNPIYLACWFMGIVTVSSVASYLVLLLKKQ